VNDELEKIKEVFNAKNNAKEAALIAVGAAKIEDQEKYLSVKSITKEAWRAMSEGERKAGMDAWFSEDESRYSPYWDEWKAKGIEGDEGRLQAEFQQLCDKYVADHPDEFTNNIRAMDIKQLVTSLSVFRAAGFETEQWIIEVWLKHHFEPQVIGGPIKARIRFPNGGVV